MDASLASRRSPAPGGRRSPPPFCGGPGESGKGPAREEKASGDYTPWERGLDREAGRRRRRPAGPSEVGGDAGLAREAVGRRSRARWSDSGIRSKRSHPSAPSSWPTGRRSARVSPRSSKTGLPLGSPGSSSCRWCWSRPRDRLAARAHGNLSNFIGTGDGGGLADISAAVVTGSTGGRQRPRRLPHYRNLFARPAGSATRSTGPSGASTRPAHHFIDHRLFDGRDRSTRSEPARSPDGAPGHRLPAGDPLRPAADARTERQIRCLHD
jgi:hypothetical protein